jgi:hypothetical protein
MKKEIIIIILTFSNILSYSQKSIIANHLNSSTKLYFFEVYEKKEKLACGSGDTLFNFYISGVDSIKSIKKKFRYKKTKGETFCGYDYLVYQANDNKIVRSSWLNLKCRYAYIDDYPCDLFIDSAICVPKSGPIYFETLPFDDINKARMVRLKALEDKNVIIGLPERDLWSKFDGQFGIRVDLNEKNFIKFLNKFNIKYKLDVNCDVDEYHIFTITSNYELYEKIQIGKKDKWEPFCHFGIELFSTDKKEIEKYKNMINNW